MIEALFDNESHRAKLLEILRLARDNSFEEGHSVQVSRLSIRLFDELQGLHELSSHDRYLLAAGGLLHDIGVVRSYEGHHKNSRDMVLELPFPFDAAERLFVANLVRYHRKSAPKASHALFQQLAAEDQQRLKKLAALLRIADGLDRAHSNRVYDLKTHVEPQTVVIYADAHSHLICEAEVLVKKADLFSDVYARSLRLSSTAESA